jgi:hypothetical protein
LGRIGEVTWRDGAAGQAQGERCDGPVRPSRKKSYGFSRLATKVLCLTLSGEAWLGSATTRPRCPVTLSVLTQTMFTEQERGLSESG